MKKKVRIKDIADKVGVSTGTVDRVLHNRGKVAADVKKRVLEAVEELGYQRNPLASALAYNRTLTVSVLLPDPSLDPFWTQTDQGIQQAAKAVQHYGIVVNIVYFDLFNADHFKTQADSILTHKPNAVLFPPLFVDEALSFIQSCEAQELPYIIINTKLNTVNYLSYIGQDSYQSGVLGARLLNFGLNAAETVCILNLDYSTQTAHHLLEKERGFRAYFAQHQNNHIQIIREDFEDFNNPNLLKSFLTDLLKTHPALSGIFVTNSRSYKIIDALNELNERPIKIIGFDLIEENLKYLKADTIDFLINQNPFEQGYKGIMSIFKHLILKESIEKDQLLPLDIVVKENVKYYLQRQAAIEAVV